MIDEQQWMQRLDAYLAYLRDELGRDEDTTVAKRKQVLRRWVSFALGASHDPAVFEHSVVQEFLATTGAQTPGTKDDYEGRVRAWCRWCREQQSSEATNCWVVRAGRHGEAVEHNLIHNVVTIGWGWGDWSSVAEFESRDEFGDFIDEQFPDELGSERRSARDQIWRFGREIQVGNLVVMPMKGVDGNPIAIGRIDGPFEFDPTRPEYMRIRRAVTWLGTGIERDAIGQDLLYSMDSSGTVFGLRKHDAVYRVRHLAEHGVDPGPRDAEAAADQYRSVRLAQLVAEFRATGYPSDDNQQHEQARVGFEQTLRSLPDIAHDEREAVKAVWNPAEFDYGSVGYAGAGANKLVNNASEQDWPLIRSELAEVCFGSDDEATRLDRAAASGVLSGVRYVVGTRLLAICQPHEVIPIYLLRKSRKYPGVIDMIEVLDRLDLIGEDDQQGVQELLSLPTAGLNSGAVVMRANDLLLDTLRPHFSDDGDADTWGMSKFLYWVMERHANGDETEEPWVDEADLPALADDLLCDVRFLKDIVALLEDKGQVILYGPPGTGKTHFAAGLAWMLTDYGDEEVHEAYSLVQFHPAYSYEDFFEGFRPQVDDDGQMTYQLTAGPLVQLAERAEDHPEELHVMVIDEINRANLPRVLGELLYLLEYRNESIQTQYRPDEDFSLPENLWFIGTMNTADRSIALIDAAMRRRFHFVPFFPDREPTAGLLRKWYEENELEQDWVAELLDAVNERLRADLGGDYMLIGPSHFMKHDLDENGLRRIWEYNIEPLIEDQFFGRQEVIDSYRFGEVWKRHGPGAATSASEMGTTNEFGEEAEPGSDHDGSAESDGDL
ncbi:AAA family ATPase [Candidatus Poriferisodalis sp.]|uniref:AAA family ATPase n=1 Tax=Candidatus Poriferisodalis sp. TaxID=3101277 RepID=UPI003B02D58F